MPRYLNTLLIASLAWTTPAAAQDAVAGEPLRLYRVEVIVFAYSDGNPTEELFEHERGDAGPPIPAVSGPPPVQMQMPPVIRSFGLLPEGQPGWLERGPLPVPGLAPIILADPVDPYPVIEPVGAPTLAGGGGQTPPPAPPRQATSDGEPGIGDSLTDVTAGGLRFRLLKRDELKLNDSERRLRNLSAYDVLAHGGWVQEALPENAALPFDLGYLGAVNPAGTIQLHVTRYLHLSFDLRYRVPYTEVAGSPLELSEIEAGRSYRLQDQRRARSNELHYIDHPLFGVLVLVTPQERATDESPAA